MKRLRVSMCVVVAAITFGAAAPAQADEDVYFVKRAEDLQILEGKLPLEAGPRRYRASYPQERPYYAVLEGGGEACVGIASWSFDRMTKTGAMTIAGRVPKGKDVVGRLFVPKPDGSGMVMLKFTVASGQLSATVRKDFLRVKEAHYQRLLDRGIPGAAWFRHQVRQARMERDEPAKTDDRGRQPDLDRPGGATIDATFGLVSGNRALSENLQLERLLLPANANGQATVSMDWIEGIIVREFDWSKRIEGLKPELDRLASLIPHDQHALFFPSYEAMTQMADHADAHRTPILQAIEPRAQSAMSHERYETQLCLPVSTLARLLGPHLVKSVAITGGDPYLRMGTDIAILFEAKNHTALRTLLGARVAVAAESHASAQHVQGKVKDLSYTGVRSPDRKVCSYVTSLGDAVVVTNSLAQIERLLEVCRGRSPSLASLGEYVFFRDRYKRGEADETAFLIVSDATIRRWCGPRWRIADSRRVRAAAVLAESQAARLDQLVRGTVEVGPIEPGRGLQDIGGLSITEDGVVSETYGSLEFQTPVIEMDIKQVTREETNLYCRWRDSYQRNWSNYFDPIAIRFSVRPGKAAADMTVMPLIEYSDYREFVEVTRGAEIEAGSGDPHKEALVHGVMALDRDSLLVKNAEAFATTFARTLYPLRGWLGRTVAVYFDDDPLWKELAATMSTARAWELASASILDGLPIALHVEVASGVKLAAFLVAVRTYVDQTVPGMFRWETRKHGDEAAYVKITPTDEAVSRDELDKLALYYAVSGDALIVTFNENMLQRAIVRQGLRRDSTNKGLPQPQTEGPWLGKHLCLRVGGDVAGLVENVLARYYHSQMQTLAWGNLPILNEWKRRYPDRDPLEVHRRLWRRQLLCPGGGTYRWNEQWQTMESTVYGHPGEQGTGAALPAILRGIVSANFGLTFEEDGFRARVELQRKDGQ